MSRSVGPANFVDCGTCQCVPEPLGPKSGRSASRRSSCAHCPGAWTAGGDAPTTVAPQISMQPSVVPYCPASYMAGSKRSSAPRLQGLRHLSMCAGVHLPVVSFRHLSHTCKALAATFPGAD